MPKNVKQYRIQISIFTDEDSMYVIVWKHMYEMAAS